MRLAGFALITARKLAEKPGGARILRQKVFNDYGIDELLALPRDAREPLRPHAGPLEQKRRRGWSGADLDSPSRPASRTTAADLRDAYRRGVATPTEVIAQLRRRIEEERFGESIYSPFCCLDFDRAASAAEQSTERYEQGEALGPLDGIPTPVKDHFLMEGLAIQCGSVLVDEIADEDAHLVEVLRTSGAFPYAKTHTTEWGMNPCGFSPDFSLPRNPYDRHFAAGGSSTGAAVAVALGMTPVATGSDGGGSIRIPAAMCGVFGLKPTYLRIGRTGDLFGASSVSVTGPIGASTADLVDFLAPTAEADDPEDPARRWGPAQRDLLKRWRRAVGRGVDGCRIGIPQSEWDDLHGPLQQPTLDALYHLEREGAELVDVDIPLAEHAPAIGALSIGMETRSNLADEYADNPDAFSDELRMTLEMLGTITADEYLDSQRTRAAVQYQMRDVLDDVDLVALPTTRTTAPPYGPDADGIPLTDDTALRDMTRFTFLANITGLPAGSVPAGRHKGLPFGVQFVGGSWDEASVIAAMAHAERIGFTSIDAPPGREPLLDDR